MKKLFAAALAAIASIAFGATTTPVQLLNPAGSVAGQAILSTGPTSAPAWGTVALSGVTGTLGIANGGTGATSASAALANLGGLSTTSAASTYLTQSTASSTYLTQTNAASTYATITNLALKAPLSSPTFTGTVTIPTGASITKPNIVGTATNDNAAAGSVGEYVSNSATGVALTSGTAANITSVSLTAGDWDVSGTISFVPAGTTVPSAFNCGTSTTSATLGALGTQTFSASSAFPAGSAQGLAAPTQRISVSATTTVYLVGSSAFTTSTMTANGFIRARRVR
ncbi:hypothetical protein [Caballeronia sp. AZ10_KS36]|uniref:hypothetical protein n=1 Tax=Caballeronia sp. AZ10_KS36 TaxID=2921757 RepID=UPI0020297CFE|nr:hypothetical protein [Caballeronia sp. AZ10_KS36]